MNESLGVGSGCGGGESREGGEVPGTGSGVDGADGVFVFLLLLLLAVPAIAIVTSIIPTLRNAFNFGFVDADTSIATNAVLDHPPFFMTPVARCKTRPTLPGKSRP